MLRYWGFRASFQPIFLENAAHNTAQYGVSRPAGRWRRRQAANHIPRLCVLRYRTNQASNPTQTKHPDIAARTASGRGVRRAQVMSDQSRRGKSGRGRAPAPGQTDQTGWGWAAWLGRGGFRRRKAREIQDLLIKITLTQTVIHTPQLPLMKQGKTQVSKK